MGMACAAMSEFVSAARMLMNVQLCREAHLCTEGSSHAGQSQFMRDMFIWQQLSEPTHAGSAPCYHFTNTIS